MSQKNRIAVFAHSLHGHRPRGFQRVSRALTEALLAQVPENVEFRCLLHKSEQQYELTYVTCDLREWLARHPLVIPEAGGRLARMKAMLHNGIGQFLPPIVHRVVHRARNLAHRILRRLPLAGRLASRWNKLRYLLGKRPAPHLATQEVVLDELDAIISFEPFDDIWNEPVHRCRTRLINWFHDAIPKRIHEGHYWNPDRFDRAMTNASYRAHRIMCVSRSAEQDLLTFFPAAQGKTQVIHLGHDLERFASGAACDRVTAQAVLAKHGISPRIPYLFFLGAVEPRKNMVNVLRACQVIRRRNPRLDFQLVLAGDVSGQTAILKLIERTRRWLPVHALRYTTDAESAILAGGARALLNPSLWEGFGIPILEGMTAGAVVIASDLSSMPEVCAGHAILCDPYDINDMAEKFLRTLTMNARERHERSAAAREYSSQFTWQRAAATLWGVVEEELAVHAGDASAVETIEFERACA